MRRVVVTGIGSVNPLGTNAKSSWDNIISGKSGASSISRFDASDLPCQIACEINHEALGFNTDDWLDPKERKRVDDFILYGIAAADMALADSGYQPETDEQFWRSGVMIGSGLVG